MSTTSLPARLDRLAATPTEPWTSLLGAVSSAMPLWEIDAGAYRAADTLRHAFVRPRGIGPTKAGKLVARRRPAVIPIFDDAIGAHLAPSGRGLWCNLHDALRDSERRIADRGPTSLIAPRLHRSRAALRCAEPAETPLRSL